MKAISECRYFTTQFSESKGDRYEGHLTIHVRWGDYYPQGNNPLAHKLLDKLVDEIRPILRELGIHDSVVNCNWGEWKDVTFQYINEVDVEIIFNKFIELFGKLAKDN